MQAAATGWRGGTTCGLHRQPNRLVSTVRDLSVACVGAALKRHHSAPTILYKMVRSLAGFLIESNGAVPEQTADAILQSRKRTAHVPTAPPQGYFWRVYYRRTG